ncbi:LamG domain-containing protein [Aquirufa aurantiipilula]
MKHILFLSMFFFLLYSCKTEEPQTPPVVITSPATEITLSKAKINGEVTNEGFSAASERGFVMSETNPKPSVSDTKYTVGYGKGTFFKELDNLKVNTKYYFSAFATNTKGTSYGEILNFTTADYALATVTMEEPKNITYTTVQLTGNVTDEGGTEVTERGFCLNNAPNPTSANIKIVNGKGSGAFSTVITQLKEDSTYYTRSYAINGKGISYGKEFNFKTLAFKKPLVETNNPSNVSAKTATLNGNITDRGGAEIKEKGFLIGIDQNPIGKIEVTTNDSVKYNYELKDLKFNTKYYFKAYATNIKGTSYGETLNFTTADYLLASLTSEEPKNINYTSVQLTSSVIDDGGDEVSERGFCLNTSPSPTISNIKIPNGKGKGAYSTVVTQLKDETTYYFRAYAINSKGVSYGKEYTFKTLEYKKPTVETGVPLNIGTRSVTLSGKMVDNGGTDITEKGFLFGTNQNPTDRILVSIKAPDLYTIDLRDLKSSTKYYFKAFSTNSKGTSIGLENSFVTLTPSFAKVGTNDFADITDNSVRAGLEIDNDGGSPITEYGICFSSTNSNPTIYDNKVLFGNAVNPPFGEMRKITGLISSTTYYLKAFAVNERGISYGPVKSFKTLVSLPGNLKNGLVAYYPFNGNAFDVSGNGSNGSNFGAILSADRFGLANSSYYFSSISCSPRIQCLLNTNSIVKDLTISIWVLKMGIGCSISPRILDFASSPLDGPGQLQFTFGYNNAWAIGHIKSNGTDLNSPSFQIGQVKWSHFVYTNNGETASYYQDGVLIHTQANGNGIPILAKNLTIGRMNHPAYDAFDGKLDDLGIWNRALTPEEIRYLYQNNFQP